MCVVIYSHGFFFMVCCLCEIDGSRMKQWLLNIDDSGIIHVYYSLSFLLYGLSNLGVTQ